MALADPDGILPHAPCRLVTPDWLDRILFGIGFGVDDVAQAGAMLGGIRKRAEGAAHHEIALGRALERPE